ncbi:Annexin A7 [Lasiodiplodia theobromae]|uniref:Annexin A7 n=2 Tax=Lasiodiplodia theobromae TaxID=45133 RepID=A0A5N5D104_9PEZI|nr:Annexin A7 [Lasiodiplodia theobromae]
MSRSTPTRQWFQPGDGIAREVITADIQRYLGPDALVKPGIGTGEYEGVEGYWITAYRTLTSQMVQDLKLDSQRWRAEVQQGRVAYQDSRTHQSRQYYGPSTPAPEQPYAPPSASQVYADHPSSAGYRAPAQSAYGGGDYTYAQPQSGYAQQGAHYVPAPGYGQGQVRTTPSYGSYSQPPGREPEPHYSGHQESPRYGYPPSTSAPPERVYAPPQPSTTQQYYYADSRSAATQPPPQANDRRRRQ